MRIRSVLIVLLCSLVVNAARGDALQRSLAVIDPLALREIDRAGSTGFGLGRMLDPARSTSLNNAELFALPAIAPVRQVFEAEFERYVSRHKMLLPRETIGVGPPHDFQLFEQGLLWSGDTRFVLVGIVNRMDRAYVAPETCGEIRLIYRLTRIGEDAARPRLPMTLNLVLRAKEPSDSTITCAELARRWLAASDLPQTGAELTERLLASDGAFSSIKPDNIDRIETNLQIAHAPKSATRDFRTDYLQKVFRYDAASKTFIEAPMENQIDRDRLLADAGLARDFKSWLLDPAHLGEFDRGTILIPEKFLATSSVAATPAGFERSVLQPEYGLMQSDHAGGKAVFTDGDVVSALKAAMANGVVLQNVRTPAGFARRLNDITCGGCHQVRGIGGFHFPGVDWIAEKPSNTTTVPASPHFVGDQPRRRAIVAAMRDAVAADYSRGFSDRPQMRGSAALAGTGYLDGWGATCYRTPAKMADRSFASWNCAEGLSCQPVDADKASRIGMCFVK
ncbi:MAG: hypothetical protein JWR89_183 [Tardiphaga sp.]|uniref:hypothetical protein n=1 Tax=Tardiphaga sp. TaxID=1926292 RepID=UPI0026057481|nr:hypothetical protein [Tardiphaga sp.]MDB5500281.1 hypothetical protein [Tardiphaga sp.]